MSFFLDSETVSICQRSLFRLKQQQQRWRFFAYQFYCTQNMWTKAKCGSVALWQLAHDRLNMFFATLFSSPPFFPLHLMLANVDDLCFLVSGSLSHLNLTTFIYWNNETNKTPTDKMITAFGSDNIMRLQDEQKKRTAKMRFASSVTFSKRCLDIWTVIEKHSCGFLVIIKLMEKLCHKITVRCT